MEWVEKATKGSENAGKLLYNKGLRIVVGKTACFIEGLAATLFLLIF
jgi:hypothetical protein